MTNLNPDVSLHPESGLRRLWHYARGHRMAVIGSATATTLGKLMDVAPEILIGVVVDVVVRGENSFFANTFGIHDRWHQLLILAGLNAIIWIFESVFGYLSAVGWRNLSQTIEHQIRTDLYRHVQGLEVGYFEDTSSGGILSVLNDDVNQLERFLDTGAATILNLFWNIVFVGAVFAASSWLIMLLAIVPIPVIVWGSLRFQRTLGPRYAAVREAVGEMSTTISRNLSGITTIKAFTAESSEAARVERVSHDYLLANREAIRVSSAFGQVIRMAILTGFTCTLVVGGWMVLHQRMQVGIYSVLVFMTQRLLWPMVSLGDTLDQYQRAMASTRRIFRLMDTQPQMVDGTARLPEPIRGDIELKNVNFGYGDGPDVVSGLDLRIPAGETHGIVGATGAGKSTILRLLLRFSDARSGDITIDGHSVQNLAMAELRRHFGYVSQDVFLFHGTVRENIAFGKPGATDEEIERAARQAEAHEFILGLPNGYDTVVGDRGQKLSGGQRQRLSLARAIVRDPAILLLDEATSAVDNETEAAIQRSMAHVTQGRTSIVVAHRLSTVRDAHRIWVLEGGRVIEAGTHDELLGRDGLYSALWRVQTGEMAGIGR